MPVEQSTKGVLLTIIPLITIGAHHHPVLIKGAHHHPVDNNIKGIRRIALTTLSVKEGTQGTRFIYRILSFSCSIRVALLDCALRQVPLV